MSVSDPSPEILYIISHGFAARMVLHSGLLDALRDGGVRVVIVAPNAEEEGMRSLAEEAGATLVAAPTLPTRFSSEYERFRRYLFEDVRGNPALWAKHLRDVRTEGRSPVRKAQAHTYRGLNWLSRRSQAVRSGLQRV